MGEAREEPVRDLPDRFRHDALQILVVKKTEMKHTRWRRHQQGRRRCRFRCGLDGQDALPHALECLALATTVSQQLELPLAPGFCTAALGLVPGPP